MDIVKKVAADIAEIPGSPHHEVIARVAIEAYQREMWTPYFVQPDSPYGGLRPELRRMRATRMVAQLMQIIGPHLCDHGDRQDSRDVSRELMDIFYESGIEVITDQDRRAAGLATRGPYGLTVEELRALDTKYLDAMKTPARMLILEQFDGGKR